ncbi:7TM-DISM domain-containing protein [Aquimarina aquimarini]|uniref:7TM-DISM domain-containing protein n=1 Tax=Aquimarina aquimarini TaxID=1191734 RepID=UPI000D56273E|nr:7TM-DISM domain-containing protein [Aquimarina aquimarini]
MIKQLPLISVLIFINIYSCYPNIKTIDGVTYSYKCYIDKTNKYTIDELKEIPFKHVPDINFPFFKGNIWIKIKLINTTFKKKELAILNNDIINRSYKFYQLDKNNNNNLFIATNNKSDIDNRTFIFFIR